MPEENNKDITSPFRGLVILCGTELEINGVLIVVKTQNGGDMKEDIFASIKNVIQFVVLCVISSWSSLANPAYGASVPACYANSSIINWHGLTLPADK